MLLEQKSQIDHPVLHLIAKATATGISVPMKIARGKLNLTSEDSLRLFEI
jgi:hypothetical protein